MAFPASTSQAAQAWTQACNLALAVKNETNRILTLSQTVLPANQAINYTTFLAGAIASFNQYSAVGGIGAYAQGQVNNPSLNVTTEFSNMVAAIQNVINWVVNNFPKDASNNLLYEKFNVDGTQTFSSFAQAQLTAAFIPLLQALIATIN
jgi:hypothetical protein